MARPRDIGDKIIALRKQDKSYNDIKKELNCSKSTIYYHCKKHDLTDIGKKQIEINDELAELIYRYTLNHTLKETANHFNICVTTVKKYKDIIKKGR